MKFKNREEAGRKLAQKLLEYKDKKDAIVLGLPRGGVVLAAEAAKTLNLPLDITSPRKIGHPANPEYAIGAITETGKGIWNEAEKSALDQNWLQNETAKEKNEARRRLETYRGGRSEPEFSGKTVILIDDGIATGLTMRAAIAGLRTKTPRKIIVAAPVSARDSAEIVRKEADELIVLYEPAFFDAVGAFYDEFPQVEDQKVINLLRNESF